MENFKLSLDLPKFSNNSINTLNTISGKSEEISSIAKYLDKIAPKSIFEQGVNVVKDFNKFNSDLENKEVDKLKSAEEKEQALREHLEMREDTKYQRTLSDLRKSGVNPNLFNNINVGQYSASPSSTIENILKEQLQDEQLSNETFNKIVQVVGTIVGALIFKKL